MAAQLYVAVTSNVPAARAAVYGSMAEFQHFGNVVAAAVPCPILGNVWGPPAESANASPLFVWGVWATMDPGPTATGLFAKLTALAALSTIQLYVWDPVALPETLEAFTARWQSGCGWVPIDPSTPPSVPIT